MSSYKKYLPAAIVLAGIIATAVAINGWPSSNSQYSNGNTSEQPVIVAPALEKSAIESISSVGTTRANEAVIITSKVTGRLEQILFDDGQIVTEGQDLVKLDSREMDAELQRAEVNLKQLQQEYDRVISLRGKQAVSESRVEELTALKGAAEAQLAATLARLEEFTIKAPFTGTIGIHRLSRGALISPTTQITTLDDLSVIKVDFAIPETHMLKTSTGDRVFATSRALEDFEIVGAIENLDVRVDPVSRTIAAVAKFDNASGMLKPGMFLNLRIDLEEKPAAVFVAEEALQPAGNEQFVFVVKNGIVERRSVTVGLREPGLVEIVKGVEAGELIVVRGTQFMRNGMEVDVIETIESGDLPTYQQS